MEPITLTEEQIKKVFLIWNNDFEGETHTHHVSDSVDQAETFIKIAKELSK